MMPWQDAVRVLVMSAEPSTGAGHTLRMRKSLQTSTPWLTGVEPRTMVFSPGSVGQVSLRATTPPVLVMTSTTRRKFVSPWA